MCGAYCWLVLFLRALLSCHARSFIKQCTIVGGGLNLKACAAATQLGIETSSFVFCINEVRRRHLLVTSILEHLSRPTDHFSREVDHSLSPAWVPHFRRVLQGSSSLTACLYHHHGMLA